MTTYNPNEKFSIHLKSIGHKGKVVLIYPRTYHEKNYRHYWIPYSVLNLATLLREDNTDVVIIDNNLHQSENHFRLMDSLLDDCICVGISSMIGYQILDALKFAETVRSLRPELPIIWGGLLPTTLPGLLIENPYVDAIVVGQGEFIFRDIVRILEKHSINFSSIEGVYWKNNPPSFQNLPPFIDINLIRFYCWDLIDVKRYLRDDENINTRTINYIASEGCPFTCGFCIHAQPISGRKWTMLEAHRIVEDVTYLVNTYDCNGIKFYDANFFVDKNQVMKFVRGIDHLGIRWAASAHPLNVLGLSGSDFRLLEQSGCSRLLIGAESGSQEELDLIKKGIRVEDILHVADMCSKFNIHGSFTFIVGFPGSSEENFLKTLNIAEKIREIDSKHECKIHFYAPYPSTPLYSESLKHGFRPPQTLEKWAEYDYYNINTPWIKSEWEELVHEFNREHSPYIEGSRWRE